MVFANQPSFWFWSSWLSCRACEIITAAVMLPVALTAQRWAMMGSSKITIIWEGRKPWVGGSQSAFKARGFMVSPHRLNSLMTAYRDAREKRGQCWCKVIQRWRGGRD